MTYRDMHQYNMKHVQPKQMFLSFQTLKRLFHCSPARSAQGWGWALWCNIVNSSFNDSFKGKGLSVCSKYLPQLVVDHHVVGLYVPVHDAHTVAVVQCLAENKTHTLTPMIYHYVL